MKTQDIGSYNPFFSDPNVDTLRLSDGTLIEACDYGDYGDYGAGMDGSGAAYKEFYKAPSTAVNDLTKSIRKTVAELGYKALTGTKRQKEWAEKIRQECVDRLPAGIKHGLVDQTKAAFWIDNRNNGSMLFKIATENADRITRRETARNEGKLAAKAAAQVAAERLKVELNTDVFQRIMRLSAANGIAIEVNKVFYSSAEKYAPLMDLTDEMLVDYITDKAKMAATNTNDPNWKIMKSEMERKFGFYL